MYENMSIVSRTLDVQLVNGGYNNIDSDNPYSSAFTK